jgi:hypothetical protein
VAAATGVPATAMFAAHMFAPDMFASNSVSALTAEASGAGIESRLGNFSFGELITGIGNDVGRAGHAETVFCIGVVALRGDSYRRCGLVDSGDRKHYSDC